MKARVETAYGEWVERIPAWVKWATQVPTQPHIILTPALAHCCTSPGSYPM